MICVSDCVMSKILFTESFFWMKFVRMIFENSAVFFSIVLASE